ncbi:immunity 53 family protein [Acetivibrio saccincola]|uniref:Rhodanese-related sulfurtransferase n=1 Tax=Acetivibrio saccincola TaxID=1677857 RepID=A0A2K9EMS4_9FIRM|nr:immunity 53 family protein [Acetivibrio saccincola]AUG56760.1 hypothetical protein HVS_04090 [Acetivibrio saccincola]PQQ66814.1 rhodanese-related sulfurtransferase [Acetivibrio saccincola]
MDLIKWIEEWYLSNCNNDWEHCYGVKIDNIDNPGWTINIDLIDTPLENKDFKKVEFNRDKNDWFICKVKNNVFQCIGGPRNLGEMLSVFKQWVESN